ncbi:MAG: pirin family protein [bacterium]|nr:pirin family protein [bacterium]
MINVIRADERYFSDFGWLKTYWLFSFSDYFDPGNLGFGPLRVFNDDVVEPGTGFPTHPHQEMEIISIILFGEITHEDSMGNNGVIRAGEVQRMTAGIGIQHSEFNRGLEPLHLYQIWISPRRSGSKPSYGQRNFAGLSRKNRLLPVASGQGLNDVVSFNADATIYLTELEKGKTIEYDIESGRRVFIYMTDGSLEVDYVELKAGDQARIENETALALTAISDSSVILIDLP